VKNRHRDEAGRRRWRWRACGCLRRRAPSREQPSHLGAHRVEIEVAGDDQRRMARVVVRPAVGLQLVDGVQLGRRRATLAAQPPREYRHRRGRAGPQEVGEVQPAQRRREPLRSPSGTSSSTRSPLPVIQRVRSAGVSLSIACSRRNRVSGALRATRSAISMPAEVELSTLWTNRVRCSCWFDDSPANVGRANVR
jgi:hypothetical protein